MPKIKAPHKDQKKSTHAYREIKSSKKAPYSENIFFEFSEGEQPPTLAPRAPSSRHLLKVIFLYNIRCDENSFPITTIFGNCSIYFGLDLFTNNGHHYDEGNYPFYSFALAFSTGSTRCAPD